MFQKIKHLATGRKPGRTTPLKFDHPENPSPEEEARLNQAIADAQALGHYLDALFRAELFGYPMSPEEEAWAARDVDAAPLSSHELEDLLHNFGLIERWWANFEGRA